MEKSTIVSCCCRLALQLRAHIHSSPTTQQVMLLAVAMQVVLCLTMQVSSAHMIDGVVPGRCMPLCRLLHHGSCHANSGLMHGSSYFVPVDCMSDSTYLPLSACVRVAKLTKQHHSSCCCINAGSNGSLNGAAAGPVNGVEITEIASTAEQSNSPRASPAPWRPPPVPQSSLNLGKHHKSESSSSA